MKIAVKKGPVRTLLDNKLLNLHLPPQMLKSRQAFLNYYQLDIPISALHFCTAA